MAEKEEKKKSAVSTYTLRERQKQIKTIAFFMFFQLALFAGLWVYGQAAMQKKDAKEQAEQKEELARKEEFKKRLEKIKN